MNTTLILFGIRSIVRIGQVGRGALEQWARDDEAIFPDLKEPDFNARVIVSGFFQQPGHRDLVMGDNAPYAEHWEGNAAKPDAQSIDSLFTLAVKIQEEESGSALDPTFRQSGAVLIKQWGAGKGPVSPWARVVLTAGDIALEYIAIDPGILKVGGNGEKLIAAYAKELSELLPDDGRFGVREDFGQRLLTSFLRAGFQTISENPQWIVSEDHLQQLITASVAPLVEALPSDITVIQQVRWQNLAETIMGPAASAALKTVAANPSAFLGNSFEAEKALGVLTTSLFNQAAETGILNQINREGLLGLYETALGVAADHPQLFIRGDDPGDILARDLFAGFASALQASPPPFDGDVGMELAKAALTAVSDNAHHFADADDPWEQTAVDMVKSLTGTLRVSFDNNDNLRNVFSGNQLVELGRILLTRIAASPAMITGSAEQSWGGVLTAVATAMAADTKLLLSGDDWMDIVRTAADEAATNPGRLFALNPGDPDDVLAGQLISMVLKSATEAFGNDGAGNNSVLFGKTLREAINIVIRANSGNPAAAEENLVEIEALLRGLNGVVAENPLHFGSKEWLRVFRLTLTGVLEGDTLPQFTRDSVNEWLERG